jgi:ribosome biogenesis GTPase
MINKLWGTLPVKSELDRCASEGLSFGRIIRENRGHYLIASDDNVLNAEISGAYRYRAAFRSDYPAVGDWSTFRTSDDGHAVIEWIFNRRSTFSRKSAGVRTEEQIIAANIDTIFLVFGINGGRNFTAGGLERYLTLAWDSGAMPVVVLNKADLCTEDERESALLTAEASAPGVEVHLVSAATGEGRSSLVEGLSPGTTIALTGPSGVGKSTLINALAENTLQETGSQRETDLRGRHTTTHRELFRLDSGLLMIDSPGLRELQLWGDPGSADSTFSDIAEIAEGCRFSDCSHQGEPGCAVQAALSSGELENRRYESYLELRKELDYLNRKQDIRAAEAETKKWKEITKQMRRLNKG